MNTREKIIETARQLVLEKGAMNVTILEVASEIGISHAAIYKYFKNKQELLASIAQTWLDETSASLFSFDTTKYTTKAEIAHAWLWELARSKKEAHENHPQMFELYTKYIEQDPKLSKSHTVELAKSYAEATGSVTPEEDFAALQAFMPFTDPHYAPTWDEHFQERFEAVWRIVAPYFERDL
jgi:AcrR family transcriptional regulator